MGSILVAAQPDLILFRLMALGTSLPVRWDPVIEKLETCNSSHTRHIH